MSGGDWNALARLGLVVRPFAGLRPPLGHRRSQFSASLGSTVRLLAQELRAVNGQKVVLELDVFDRDIRLDGLPRSNARPDTPAVALAFESKHGPLRYATGEFRHWGDNLRAIALGLEALRAVDRYSISRRGEQYVGYRELPMSTDPADAVVTEEQAWAVLADAAGMPRDSSPIRNGISEKEMVKRAIRATHPDLPGGDETEFRKVARAREILGV